MPGLIQPVHLVENRLVWPVVFLYPEYKTSDMIQEFYEDSTSVYFYLNIYTLIHFNILRGKNIPKECIKILNHYPLHLVLYNCYLT